MDSLEEQWEDYKITCHSLINLNGKEKCFYNEARIQECSASCCTLFRPRRGAVARKSESSRSEWQSKAVIGAVNEASYNCVFSECRSLSEVIGEIISENTASLKSIEIKLVKKW